MGDINLRIKELVEHFSDGNNSDFAKKLGVNEANIRNYINKTEPKYSFLEKIARTFEINYEWLLLGNGSMLKKKIENNVIIPKNRIKHIELPSGKFLMKVPMIPANAFAKYISDYQDVDFFEDFEEVTFIVDKVGKGNYKAFKVKGDSMDGGNINDTEDNAIVLGRELRRDHWKDGFYPAKYGWVIVTHSNILFKDIIGMNAEAGTITCHSRNTSPEYSDFELNLNNIHQIFKVTKRTF
ncbi:helix-turn-helix domain-containing protein [Mangrovimonas cancribranchiae]|uniref:HTH cro/C1-type domain-containing protein n=1 Tax=Mangrovimonas cancribranchiae TaxID=3080055 RepID=A0AAU6P6D3_9FLAO